MASEDVYREWNAFQELHVLLGELLEKETAAAYEERLGQILKPEEASANLNRAVLRAWRAIEDSPHLVHALRVSLSYENSPQSFRLESLPGSELPISPGPLYRCPRQGCNLSLFQLYESQLLTCPRCRVKMVVYQNNRKTQS